MKPAKGHFINKMTVKVCLVLLSWFFLEYQHIGSRQDQSDSPPAADSQAQNLRILQ